MMADICNEYDGRSMILNETPEEREENIKLENLLMERMSKYTVDTSDL